MALSLFSIFASKHQLFSVQMWSLESHTHSCVKEVWFVKLALMMTPVTIIMIVCALTYCREECKRYRQARNIYQAKYYHYKTNCKCGIVVADTSKEGSTILTASHFASSTNCVSEEAWERDLKSQRSSVLIFKC